MKLSLKRLLSAHRLPVIAVIGVTREEVEAGVAHARTSETPCPIWAWCAESDSTEIGQAMNGCERFRSGVSAIEVRKELGSVWPALTIVAWRGKRCATALKLVPFTVPPFRIVVANEAGGFFPGKPGPLAEHAARRLRDAGTSGARRVSDWIRGAGMWARSTCHSTADRVWSVFLALLGTVSKCCSPLTRAATHRLRPRYSGAPIAPTPCGSRFNEIIISGRAWPRHAVLQTALDFGVDFIVFRKLSETGDPEPLIAIARETNAFAVGRQMAWAGWRQVAVTKHPFRKLQPEEVTGVLVPWSPLIVIRRDLLLRFGVPRALTFGGAVLVLCWRAASAGLTSLIAGQEGPVTQEPAMELEDADLAVHLALDGSLRGLAPANTARLRGNVASSPMYRKRFRQGLPRILIVSPYLPFPLSHGGAVRMYNLCRAMAGEVDFVLACFREAGETVHYHELHKVFREVYVVDIDEKHTDDLAPKQVVEYRNSAMAELIRSLCLSCKMDIVQLEYTQMAEYREQTGAVPVILVEHDLTFTLHEQLAKTLRTPVARRQYELWLDFERAALQCSNAVWTMSGRDQALALEYGAPRRSTLVVPNGVDLRRFQSIRRQSPECAVLFVGSFRHLPNLLAFEVLRNIIMPEVWKARPDVKLNVIAGPHHESAAEAAQKSSLLAPDPRIRIQGFVDDVRPAYRECDIALIPLPVSAGTNIKLMEAMACGRTVVCTPVGCQGLGLHDETELLIRDLDAGFAQAIIRLLNDEALRLRIAAKARQTAESRFGWDYIAAAALESYAGLANRSRKSAVRN